MRYPRASTEPLEIIRVNECEADASLATSRFQALWNEIERLRAENEALKANMDVRCEVGGCTLKKVSQNVREQQSR